jgi:preprotein translocase subunit YajC
MGLFIADAVAETTAAQQQVPPTADSGFFVMMIGLFVLMYFMIIRPQRKRQKEHETLLGDLKKGDEVVLTSGMLGKISKMDDAYVVVNTGNNIELKFQKQAVHAVLPKGTIKAIDQS